MYTQVKTYDQVPMDNHAIVHPIASLEDEHGGIAHFILDDGCYVLILGAKDRRYRHTPYLFTEAFEVLRTLPPPSKQLSWDLSEKRSRTRMHIVRSRSPRGREHHMYTRCPKCGHEFRNPDEPSPKMEPLPSYGDLMTVEEFLNECHSDDDGTGYLATETEMSEIEISPCAPNWTLEDWPDFTHVMWFNK
jgi:hypothetical protein